MPENGIRSTYSQCPFELQMYDEQEMIATGSAFFFEINDEWFSHYELSPQSSTWTNSQKNAA